MYLETHRTHHIQLVENYVRKYASLKNVLITLFYLWMRFEMKNILVTNLSRIEVQSWKTSSTYVTIKASLKFNHQRASWQGFVSHDIEIFAGFNFKYADVCTWNERVPNTVSVPGVLVGLILFMRRKTPLVGFNRRTGLLEI